MRMNTTDQIDDLDEEEAPPEILKPNKKKEGNFQVAQIADDTMELKKRAAELIEAWRLSNRTKGLNSPDFEAKKIEVMSDEKLTKEDLDFILNTKTEYDKNLNSGSPKPMQVHIVNEENWPAMAAYFNLPEKNRKFEGKSIELPFTEKGVQAVLIPSYDIISRNSERWKMFKSAIKKGTDFDPDSASEEELRELYRSIYLRNMVAHEVSHLYQFSGEEQKNIPLTPPNSQDRAIVQSQNLDLREWIACALGLRAMDENAQNADIFYRANDVAAQALRNPKIAAMDESSKYPYLQANRTVQAKRFFDLCSSMNLNSDEILTQMGLICESDDDAKKSTLRELLKKDITKERLEKILKVINGQSISEYVKRELPYSEARIKTPMR